MMKENKKGFKVWVKEHKKQLIIAGGRCDGCYRNYIGI